MEYVAHLSGGKDSTAMTLEWIRRRQQNPELYPLDEVVFLDTGMEFPQMYEHLRKVEKVIRSAGIKFTVLKAKDSFEYHMLEYKRQRGTRIGERVGWPRSYRRWCTGYFKRNISAKYFSRKDVTHLVGIAADETKRLERPNNQKKDHRHPLVEWGWEEKDCLEYCYRLGYDWGGLYEIFDRVSCWCCPLQGIKGLRKLWKHFPDLWTRLEDMDKRACNDILERYSAEELTKRFQFEEEKIKQGQPINTRAFYKELREYLGK